MKNQTSLHLSSFESLIFRFAFFKRVCLFILLGKHKILSYQLHGKNRDIANRNNVFFCILLTLKYHSSSQMLYLTYSFDWEDHARKAKDLKINSKVTKRETKSRKYYFTTIYLVSTYTFTIWGKLHQARVGIGLYENLYSKSQFSLYQAEDLFFKKKYYHFRDFIVYFCFFSLVYIQ